MDECSILFYCAWLIDQYQTSLSSNHQEDINLLLFKVGRKWIEIWASIDPTTGTLFPEFSTFTFPFLACKLMEVAHLLSIPSDSPSNQTSQVCLNPTSSLPNVSPPLLSSLTPLPTQELALDHPLHFQIPSSLSGSPQDPDPLTLSSITLSESIQHPDLPLLLVDQDTQPTSFTSRLVWEQINRPFFILTLTLAHQDTLFTYSFPYQFKDPPSWTLLGRGCA